MDKCKRDSGSRSSDPGVELCSSSSKSSLFFPGNSSSGIETVNPVESTGHLVRKKRKGSGTGHFKFSWSLLEFVTSIPKKLNLHIVNCALQ